MCSADKAEQIGKPRAYMYNIWADRAQKFAMREDLLYHNQLERHLQAFFLFSVHKTVQTSKAAWKILVQILGV